MNIRTPQLLYVPIHIQKLGRRTKLIRVPKPTNLIRSNSLRNTL